MQFDAQQKNVTPAGQSAPTSSSAEQPRQQVAVLTGINRILRETLKAASTEEDVVRVGVAVARELARSDFACIAEFDADGAPIALAGSDSGTEPCAPAVPQRDPHSPPDRAARDFYDRVQQSAGTFINDLAGNPPWLGCLPGCPPLRALLAVPLPAAGRIRGVLLAGVREGGSGAYGQEDVEALRALAPAVADALDRKRAEQAFHRHHEELIAESADMRLLQEISVALIELDRLNEIYEKIVDAACAIMRSDYASMQMLLTPEGGRAPELRLLAFRGFNPAAAAFWESVHPDSDSACGVALRTQERVIVPDLRTCAFMAGSEDLATSLQTGILSVQTTPLRSRNGNLVGMISTHWRKPHAPTARDLRMLDILARMAADLVERKQAEEAKVRHAREMAAQAVLVEQAHHAKSRFLAAASHDLRQPIAALTLYFNMLKAHVGASHQPVLDNIQNCIGNLGDLLSNLLDVSKLDAGVVTPSVTDFRIDHVLQSAVSVHFPEACEKRLRLRCVPSTLTAHTDVVLFQRMLGNLVGNAVRYTHRGGVVIGCRRRQGKVWVEVWDTGIGIPEDKTAEIFEDFKQLGDNARTRGSGLGLAIVDRTAKLLGLEVRVRSWPGRGSVFALELPLGRSEQLAPAAEPAPVLRQLRIALAEDNAAVRDALRCALESIGHRVIAAESGAQLLDAWRGPVPHIVLSDYRLGRGETALDVIAAVRQRYGASLPALIITGETGPEFMAEMARLDIAIQHKPVELDALQRRLAALVSAQFPDTPAVRQPTLARVASELDAAADLQSVVRTVKKAAREISGADGACFVLNEGTMCYYVDEDAVGPLWKGQRFMRSKCVSGWVMEHREPAVIEDIYRDARIPIDAYEPTFVRSLLAVPVGLDDPAGALTNYWASKHRASPDEVKNLQALAELVAAALKRLGVAAAA